MPSRKLIYCFLALLLSVTASRAAVPHTEYKFTHLNSSNSGLCFDGISKIVQDSRGFIWIGTFSGLNRYDGTHFQHYRKKDPGLESDFIHTILEDWEGNVWIGTDNGISRYLWRENRFEPFTIESDKGTRVRNKVTFLYCGHDGKVWMVANYQGCFCYDPKTKTLTNFRDRETKETPEYNVDKYSISFRRLVEDGKGGFWVSKYHSNLFHTDSLFRNTSVIDIPSNQHYFEGDEVEQLFMLNGKLLIASNKAGLTLYNPDSRTIESLFHLPDGVTLVDATLQDDHFIWFSTTDGVWRYDLTAKEEVLHLSSDSSDLFSIDGNYVFTTCVDREGGLWIETKDGGISYCGESQRSIQKIDSYAGGTLHNSMISGFAEGDVSMTVNFDGTLRSSVYKTGWFKKDVKASLKEVNGKNFSLVEISIPLSECPVSNKKLRVNFGLGDSSSFQSVRPSTDMSTSSWPSISLL